MYLVVCALIINLFCLPIGNAVTLSFPHSRVPVTSVGKQYCWLTLITFTQDF